MSSVLYAIGVVLFALVLFAVILVSVIAAAVAVVTGFIMIANFVEQRLIEGEREADN